MDCGGVFVKYVLFIFNILVVISGILLIVFASIVLAHSSELSSINEAFQANSVVIGILVLGCVIFIISFLGCCGAIRENVCCTMTYSVIMLLLFLLQIALIIVVWTQKDKILQSVNTAVDKIWSQHVQDPSVMDALQLSFDCCGKDLYTDYGNLTLPNSCCGPKATTCNLANVLLKPGCKSAVNSFFSKNADIVRFAGLGVAVVELVAFIFACCLGNQVRNNARRSRY